MSINDLPVLSALRTKMQWHQERQRVLSENVSNSDTPKFRPRDLVEPKLDKAGAVTGSMGPLAMTVTSASHMTPSGAASGFDQNRNAGFETPPCGQRRQSRRGDDEGRQQPDGLRGGDLALFEKPASAQDRDRQGLGHDPGTEELEEAHHGQ
ncbi:flagellar basal body rod protein FlgB [Bradyrhizobium diazoefficiens]